MKVLLELMNHNPGDIEIAALKPLQPLLIRIPQEMILRSRLLHFPNSGPLISVEYGSEEFAEAGFICYAATEDSEHGEYQILGYEGKQPGFDKYLDDAIDSLQTFSINEPENNGDQTNEPLHHVLEAGETIRLMAANKWPGLSEEDLAARVREIYAFNLARGNPLKLWDLKPGTKVYLP